MIQSFVPQILHLPNLTQLWINALALPQQFFTVLVQLPYLHDLCTSECGLYEPAKFKKAPHGLGGWDCVFSRLSRSWVEVRILYQVGCPDDVRRLLTTHPFITDHIFQDILISLGAEFLSRLPCLQKFHLYNPRIIILLHLREPSIHRTTNMCLINYTGILCRTGVY